MTDFSPITINGERFAAAPLDCPACGERVDGQRLCYEGRCPECRVPVRSTEVKDLFEHADGTDEEPPTPDYGDHGPQTVGETR